MEGLVAWHKVSINPGYETDVCKTNENYALKIPQKLL
jgi:hypothetical protein